MGEVVHGRGFGADIGRGGARESSRQSGRNAEKAAVLPIRAGYPAEFSLTAPRRAFPSNHRSSKGRQRRLRFCLCAVSIAWYGRSICHGVLWHLFGIVLAAARTRTRGGHFFWGLSWSFELSALFSLAPYAA
jgi:hypothetical protein